MEGQSSGCFRWPFDPFSASETTEHCSHSRPVVCGLSGFFNLHSQALLDVCGPEFLLKKLVLHFTDRSMSMSAAWFIIQIRESERTYSAEKVESNSSTIFSDDMLSSIFRNAMSRNGSNEIYAQSKIKASENMGWSKILAFAARS